MRLDWQWRERGSGAPYQQRVTVGEDSAVPGTAELLTLAEHEPNCVACQLQTDGAYCPEAARLVRAEREARR